MRTANPISGSKGGTIAVVVGCGIAVATTALLPSTELSITDLCQISGPIQPLKSAVQGQRYWVKQRQLLDETVRDLEVQPERITVEVGLRHLRQFRPQVSLAHAHGVSTHNHLCHFSRPCTIRMSPTMYTTTHSI